MPHPHLSSWSDMTECSIDRKKANLKTEKAYDPDLVPARIFKLASKEIAPVLCVRIRIKIRIAYWWHVQMSIIHKDLWSGKLVPSHYKRSKLSHRVLCTFSNRNERTYKWIPISNSLWEETALVNVNISKAALKGQKVMLSDMPNWGNKVIRWYTGCTLQTFVKHYESTISFFRDSHFKLL